MNRCAWLGAWLLVACVAPEPSAELPPVCPDAQVEDDDGACVPEACGVGEWGTLARTGRTLHVAPDADGDGTAEAPFGDLEDALAAATALESPQIVLAAGRWTGAWRLDAEHGDLRIEGRCASLVELDAGEAEEAVFEVVGGSPTLRGLSLRGGGAGLVLNRALGGDGIAVRMEDSVVVGSGRSGILVLSNSSDLQLANVEVREVQGLDGSRGVGLGVSGGGHATVTGGLIQGAGTFGVEAARAGSRVLLRGTSVVETWRGAGDLGVGLAAFSGAWLRAEGVELLASANVGAVVQHATLELSDVRIAGTGVDPGSVAVGGVEALEGGVLLADGLRVESGHAVGVLAGGAGASVTLTDPLLLGGLGSPEDNPDANLGISLVQGATLAVEGGRVEGWLGAGLSVGPGTQAELSDTVLVANGRPRAIGIGGALGVLDGGSAVLRGVRVEDSIGAGVVVSSSAAMSTLVLEDVSVAGTRAGSGSERSVGVVLDGAATLEADGLELADNAWASLVVQGPQAQATLRDAVIRDGRASPSGAAGYGAVAAAGGTIALVRVRLDGLREAAALSWGEGSTLQADDLVVSSLQRGTDGGTGVGVAASSGGVATLTGLSASELPGPALVAYDGGRIEARDADIRACEFAGVAVYRGGGVELIDSVLADSSRSPRDGGGVGVFADGTEGAEVRLISSILMGLRGPALYARGAGRFELDDLLIQRSGRQGGLPGGVAALNVPGWSGEVGLSVTDVRLEELEGDGIVLHASGARLESVQTQDVAGDPLHVQACEEAEEPVLVDSPALDASCRPWWREIDPALSFRMELVEIGVQ